MIITVNGKKEAIKENTQISDFLASKKLSPDKVVVEYNLDILNRENLENSVLKENDILEILRIVGGG
ncbi:MAG: sulfur carrier protein ThiS [Deltaproteobacteria bacterium]|nr:sulfur carrier protein ThiS [Deltaproteobacteria bacterium]MBW2219539.1 sulfur carrier protein ThiS [Deltaproteobacteria bacterium]